MKIIWISTPSDCEFDLSQAISRNPDITLDWYVIYDSQDKNHEFHMSQVTRAPNINIKEIGANDLITILGLATEPCDLIVFRHPLWIPNLETFIKIAKAYAKAPVIEWTWEWLPNEHLKQMPLLLFNRIAVSNSQDYKRCQKMYPKKQALYFPFGTIDRGFDYSTNEVYPECDLVCDAQPHYTCQEFNGVKRDSVDLMVRPVLDKNLILWGSRYSEVTDCDWLAAPRFAPYVKGTYPTMDYPKVYANAKVYLGVSWNATTGGFSIRLARALSCGIPVLWQDTLGGKEDIPDAKVLEWVSSPSELRQKVNDLLEDDGNRISMGIYGQGWALQNWEWTKTLRRLAKEIQ